MRIVCAICALLLTVAGCNRAPATAAGPAAANHSDQAVSFLALGDSYTIGQSVDPADRWPVQLAALLRTRGTNIAAPTIIARTGWTTTELSAAIDAENPRGPFGLVGLLIGVNDQFRGGTAEAYRPNFVALLERSIALGGGNAKHVFVVSIPDWGVMPFADGQDRSAIGSQIDRFNQVDRDECKSRGVLFIDITPISREASTQPALGASDGLHPSAAQYARWARLIDAALRSAKSVRLIREGIGGMLPSD